MSTRDRLLKCTAPGPLSAEWTPGGVAPSPCLLWTGGRDRHGYGRMRTGDRSSVGPHRVAYALAYGEIGPGMQIDHLCRVRLCVNPEHLEAVTALENWERGQSPSRINRDKTHCPYGHPYDAKNTHRHATGRHCRTCRDARNHRQRNQYRDQDRIYIGGIAVVELVSRVNWSEAARLTGTPGNTLRKRTYGIVRTIIARVGAGDGAFERSGLPPRMRTIFRKLARSEFSPADRETV